MMADKQKLITDTQVKALGENEYEIIISTETVDRDGDIIEVEGWELDNYLKNPVVLWAHDYRTVPVGKAIEIRKEAPNLVARFQFREATHANDPVLEIKGAWDQGILRAASVGFRPKQSQLIDPDDTSWWAPRRYTRQELLEFSLVPVPANQESLRRAYEAYVKGLGGHAAIPPQVDQPVVITDEVVELDERVERGIRDLLKAISLTYGVNTND